MVMLTEHVMLSVNGEGEPCVFCVSAFDKLVVFYSSNVTVICEKHI